MTCREKLKLEHPDMVDENYGGGCHGCPDTHGYAPEPEWCAVNEKICRRCWDREVGGAEPVETKKDRVVIVKLKVTAKAEYYNAMVQDLTEQLNNGLIVLPPFCDLVFVSDDNCKFEFQKGDSDES